jgi:hypothetical protein
LILQTFLLLAPATYGSIESLSRITIEQISAHTRAPTRRRDATEVFIGWKPRKEMFLVAFVFAATWFVTGSMAAHLPRLLELAGATPLAAITAAALVGPAQVAARLFEFAILRTVHPLVSARLAAKLHPIGTAALAILGATGAVAFAVLYGAGNGLLTIARGTGPLAMFGPRAYGERTGLIGAPARAAQALAPVTFGLLLDQIGLRSLAISASLCLLAFAALLFLRPSTAAG